MNGDCIYLLLNCDNASTSFSNALCATPIKTTITLNTAISNIIII